MIGRFVSERYDFARRQEIARSGPGWSGKVWQELALLGLLALPVPTADGGLGGGGVEAMIVGEAFGRALLVEPYLPCVIMMAAALGQFNSGVRASVAAGLSDGSRLFAIAAGQVIVEDNKLYGRLPMVLGGDAANALLVSARATSGELSLCLFDAIGAGVTRSNFALHGGGRAAEIVLDGVRGDEVATGLRADRAICDANAAAVGFVAAEALGAAAAAFELTLEHVSIRMQFGRPLCANQAVRHRCAEMLVELEQLRSAALLAAVTLAEPNEFERRRTLAAVKFVVNRSARFIAQQSVQLHGGLGVTEESRIGHYFKRLTAMNLLFGSSDASLAALAEVDTSVEANRIGDDAGDPASVQVRRACAELLR